MDYRQFVEIVRSRMHGDTATADLATLATLVTFAEHISPAERGHLADLLPPELRPAVLAVEGPRQVFPVEDFHRRVSERSRLARPIADDYAGAVFAALGLALTPDQFDHVTVELTPGYDRLLAEARRARDEARGPLPTEEFVRRVAQLARLDEDSARRAAEAALETLAEYLSRAEVDALADFLPPDLRAPLQRGRDRTAESRSPDDFTRKVAEREGAPPALAQEHARAAFTALRDAVPAREFEHIEQELSDDLLVLMPQA